MGLFNFISGQLLEIIEWNDDSRDTLSFRYPDEDKEIKRGAQLIVRESQVAQFVYLGAFGDTFGPGKHTLNTENIPILTTLKSWKYGFESPFKADVYYVVTRIFTGNKWGTSNPVMLRDADLGVVRARAFGTYDFHVIDPKTFLKEVAGTDNHFRLDEFNETMRSRIVSIFSEALAQAQVPIFDVAMRYSELGESLLPLINPVLKVRYGLEMTSFIVENISLPPEVEQAIDKRSTMSAIGNLNDYVKLQIAQGIGKGTSPAGGMVSEMAVGIAMLQQLNQQGGILAPPVIQQPSRVPPPIPGSPTSPATPAAAASTLDLLSPAEAANLLRVSEQDVIASIEAGDLKAKKIGATYRITRAAIDDFLK